MELAVQTREKFGKATNALRKQGLIPAELYGHGTENVHLAVNAKEFSKVFREAGENTIINLTVEGEKRSVLIHDIARHYFDNSIIHIDFRQIRMDEKLRAPVPIEFVGESPAVKEFGGILNFTMHELEVESLPADLPHRLTVPIDALKELNQSIYVKDVSVPRGVEITVDPETVIVTVTPPLKEEEIAPAPVVDVTQVKVETEEKKAEREEEKKSAEEAQK